VAVKDKPPEIPPVAPKKPEVPADVSVKETQTAPLKTPEPVPAPIAEPKPKAVEPAPAPEKPARPVAAADVSPTAPSASARDAQKPAASEGRKLYAVQVAALKDKNSAEELKKALQKKGFDAAIKTTGDPKQGQTHIVQLQPVDNMGKASTLLEQVKYVPQAKPTIITLPAGN
jgi:cell division septation protein DedD